MFKRGMEIIIKNSNLNTTRLRCGLSEEMERKKGRVGIIRNISNEERSVEIAFDNEHFTAWYAVEDVGLSKIVEPIKPAIFDPEMLSI